MSKDPQCQCGTGSAIDERRVILDTFESQIIAYESYIESATTASQKASHIIIQLHDVLIPKSELQYLNDAKSIKSKQADQKRTHSKLVDKLEDIRYQRDALLKQAKEGALKVQETLAKIQSIETRILKQQTEERDLDEKITKINATMSNLLDHMSEQEKQRKKLNSDNDLVDSELKSFEMELSGLKQINNDIPRGMVEFEKSLEDIEREAADLDRQEDLINKKLVDFRPESAELRMKESTLIEKEREYAERALALERRMVRLGSIDLEQAYASQSIKDKLEIQVKKLRGHRDKQLIEVSENDFRYNQPIRKKH